MGTKKQRKERSLRDQNFDCEQGYPNLLHTGVAMVCCIALEEPDQCRPFLPYKHNIVRWQVHICKARWIVYSDKLRSFKLNIFENLESRRECWKLGSSSKFIQNDCLKN